MTPITLSRLLCGNRPDDHPIAFRNRSPLTFSRFASDVAGTTERIVGLGHHRVALACRDTYTFAVGFFGLLHAGVEIILPPNAQPGTIEALHGAFDLLIDDAFIAGVEGRTTTLSPLDAERTSLSFFTSGSTGTPKRALKSLAMFEREAETLERLWGASAGNGPVLATVPHSHVYGLTFKVTWPLAAGRPFTSETHEFWETLIVDLTEGAVVVSSPAHLSRLGALSPVARAQKPSRVLSAGAPLSFEAANEAQAIFGIRPTEIFGSTETGAVATRQQIADDEPWRLLPGISMRIETDGCLSLHSPFVGDDWIETADMVASAGDGFRFLGRSDRIVKIEGKRVSLTETEQAITRLPWVAEAAAILIPGSPDRLAAALVLNESGHQQLAALGSFRFSRLLRSALSDVYEPANVPRSWRFIESLPSGNLGKRRDADILSLFETNP